jgi:hypothetical protein
MLPETLHEQSFIVAYTDMPPEQHLDLGLGFRGGCFSTLH